MPADCLVKSQGRGYHSLLLVLNNKGGIQTLHFTSPYESWVQFTGELDETDTSYLLYDPFRGMEYIWVNWARVDRLAMERLIGCHFEETDFAKTQYWVARAPDLPLPDQFPTSWGVMF